MTDLVDRGDVVPGLRSRGPGLSVIQECLRAQQRATPRSALGSLFGRSPLHPDARSWYEDAIGETEIAGILTQLGPDWTVLQALSTQGGTDLDHVVVGPGGVFTINTQNVTRGRLWVGGGLLVVNGRPTHHLRHSRLEAENASARLAVATGAPVHVTPVVAVVQPSSIEFGGAEPTVSVLPAAGIDRWFEAQPRIHSADEVDYLSIVAQDSGTWFTRSATDAEARHDAASFADLRAGVESARLRARGWMLAALATAVVSPIAVFAIETAARWAQ